MSGRGGRGAHSSGRGGRGAGSVGRSGATSDSIRARPYSSAPPAFNKDAHLQSHYHFVLSGSESACASLVDPDVLVTWHDVELVIADVEQEPMCPICLSPPLAAKITKCGHVYCAPCILHYLSLGSRAWSRCPLCFEPVYPNAVKSLRFRLHSKVAVGLQLRMALVQRDKHSMMLEAAAPSDSDERTEDKTDVNSAAANGDSTSSLHVERASEVDPCMDRSLLSRVTFTSDVSSICARELSELSHAASLHLSSASGGKEEPDIYYQYLLMAQEAVYRRLDEWQASHPDSADKVRRLLENAHAAQQQLQRDVAERVEKEVASKKQAEVKKQQAALPPSKRTPNMDDMSAFPLLGSAVSKPRPIRSLQPTTAATPPPTSPATAEQVVAAAANTPVPQSSVQSAVVPSSSHDGVGLSSSGMRGSRSAFFDNEEDERLHSRSLPASPSTPSLSTTPQRAAFPRFDPASSYLFYQSVDGQHLFLHSMCYRAVQAEGRALPARVVGRVEWMDHYHVDAGTRARFRFLSHLPLTTPFAIVALRLSDIVSNATVKQFAGEWSDEVHARQQRSRAQQREARRRHSSRQQQEQQYGYGRSYSDWGVSINDSPTSGGHSSFASDAYEHALLSEPTNLDSLDVQQQTAHFPTLGQQPTDNSSTASSSSGGSGSQPASPAMPSSPAVQQQWNRVAEKGLAATSAAFWAPLPAPSTTATNASPAWGRTLLNTQPNVPSNSQNTPGRGSKLAWAAAADAGKR